MTALDTRKAIQRLLNVKDDGDVGKRTRAAFDELAALPAESSWPAPELPPSPAPDGEVHSGLASSFADPADVAAFKKCKAGGGTDQACFRVGDNGIGKWGDDTTTDVPMCALPPDDWQQFGGNAQGKKVLVKANGREVVCELRDTMPWKRNVKNGAIIDLNPAAVKALGKRPPMMIPATWQWV